MNPSEGVREPKMTENKCKRHKIGEFEYVFSDEVEVLEKQLSEKEAELHRFKVKWDKFSMGVAEKKIESLEAEIERLKMLTNFPESSFKWRWAKAQEEIAELKDVLLQYELCCDKGTDYLAKKLSESQRKLERAVKFLKRFVDRCPHKLTHPCGLCDDEARDFLEELTSEESK